MKILHQLIDCESFKNSQENVYKGVYSSKIASLQCTSIISRRHHRFFSENVRKTSCLKRKFFQKLMWNSILTKCTLLVHILEFYWNQSSRWTWLKNRWKFWCTHRKYPQDVPKNLFLVNFSSKNIIVFYFKWN